MCTTITVFDVCGKKYPSCSGLDDLDTFWHQAQVPSWACLIVIVFLVFLIEKVTACSALQLQNVQSKFWRMFATCLSQNLVRIHRENTWKYFNPRTSESFYSLYLRNWKWWSSKPVASSEHHRCWQNPKSSCQRWREEMWRLDSNCSTWAWERVGCSRVSYKIYILPWEWVSVPPGATTLGMLGTLVELRRRAHFSLIGSVTTRLNWGTFPAINHKEFNCNLLWQHHVKHTSCNARLWEDSFYFVLFGHPPAGNYFYPLLYLLGWTVTGTEEPQEIASGQSVTGNSEEFASTKI